VASVTLGLGEALLKIIAVIHSLLESASPQSKMPGEINPLGHLILATSY
jgi:hypothetical protein